MTFPPLEYFPEPGIKPESPASPALQADALPLSAQGCLTIFIAVKLKRKIEDIFDQFIVVGDNRVGKDPDARKD